MARHVGRGRAYPLRGKNESMASYRIRMDDYFDAMQSSVFSWFPNAGRRARADVTPTVVGSPSTEPTPVPVTPSEPIEVVASPPQSVRRGPAGVGVIHPSYFPASRGLYARKPVSYDALRAADPQLARMDRAMNSTPSPETQARIDEWSERMATPMVSSPAVVDPQVAMGGDVDVHIPSLPYPSATPSMTDAPADGSGSARFSRIASSLPFHTVPSVDGVAPPGYSPKTGRLVKGLKKMPGVGMASNIMGPALEMVGAGAAAPFAPLIVSALGAGYGAYKFYQKKKKSRKVKGARRV